MNSALSHDQIQVLMREISREELSIYTVVVMARKDAELGQFQNAIARLRVDADKILMHSPELYELINH
jgi:hypothetical protein